MSNLIDQSLTQLDNIDSSDKIKSKIREIFKNRRQSCQVNQSDLQNLNQYFQSLEISLYSENSENKPNQFQYHSNLTILIPTVIADVNRQKILIKNINIYLKHSVRNRIILFFKKSPPVTPYFNTLMSRLTTDQQQQIRYLTYTHAPIAKSDPDQSHVGRARAAIGNYLLHYLNPKQLVVITDDRRYLNLSRTSDTDWSINDRLDQIMKYLNASDGRIVSPVSQMVGTKMKDLTMVNPFVTDDDSQTYMMAQILLGQAKTFVEIYACAYKNNAVCRPTHQGYLTTPVLSACFARLFEDCSFISAGYDNNFDMVSYLPLYRATNKVDTIARKITNLDNYDESDRENVFDALKSCVIYHKKPSGKSQEYWLRWGNQIEMIQKKRRCHKKDDGQISKDPYEFHKHAIKSYEKYHPQTTCQTSYELIDDDDSESLSTSHSQISESEISDTEDSMWIQSPISIQPQPIEVKSHKRPRQLIEYETYRPNQSVTDFDYECVVHQPKKKSYLVTWTPMWVHERDLKNLANQLDGQPLETRTKKRRGTWTEYLVQWKPTSVKDTDINYPIEICKE